MLKTSTIAAALFFAAAAAAVAANGALPNIDLQARCKNSERAIREMMGGEPKPGANFETCMKSEQAARDALQAAWSDIPASYKSFCIKPRDYSPSYIEWIACVELAIDLRKLRATTNEPVTQPSKRCPIVSYDKSGSITSIHACPL